LRVALLLDDGGIGTILFDLVLVALGARGDGAGMLEFGAALEEELAQDAKGIAGSVITISQPQPLTQLRQ
jgi:hypothetical protein